MTRSFPDGEGKPGHLEQKQQQVQRHVTPKDKDNEQCVHSSSQCTKGKAWKRASKERQGPDGTDLECHAERLLAYTTTDKSPSSRMCLVCA